MLDPGGLDAIPGRMPTIGAGVLRVPRRCLAEPWDGPAAVASRATASGWCGCSTATACGRRGYVRTRDGLVVVASEVGVLDLDPADVVERGRLGPGQMLLVLDTAAGRCVRDRRAQARARRGAAVPRRGSTSSRRGARRRCPTEPATGAGCRAEPARCSAPSATREEDARARRAAPMARDGRRSRSARWATTRRWRVALGAAAAAAARTSSSTSRRSRTRPSTRSARRS